MKLPQRRRISPAIVVGEILLTTGLALAGYLLWGEVREHNYASDQTAAAEQLQAAWSEQGESAIDAPTGSVELGKGFAILELPSLDPNYQRVIAQGVDNSVLNDRTTGVGHYPRTSMPWESGNFALAAHRLGNGGAFQHIDKLAAGDEIRVSVGSTTWVYEVTHSLIVSPQQTSVLNASADRDTITLTTCHPIYDWSQRLVVKGDLVRVIDAAPESVQG